MSLRRSIELESKLSEHASPAEVDALVRRLSSAASEAAPKAAPRTLRSAPVREPGTALVVYREKRRFNEAGLIGLAIAAATLPIVGYTAFQHTSPTAFFSTATRTATGKRVASVHPAPPPPPIADSRPPVSSLPSPRTKPDAHAPGRSHTEPPRHASGRSSVGHRPVVRRSDRAPVSETERTRRLNVRELHRLTSHRRIGRPEEHRRNATTKKTDRVTHEPSRREKPAVVGRDNSAQAYAEDAAITRRLNLREQQRERRRDRR